MDMLRRVFNAIRLDGKVTTCHGNTITPYEIYIRPIPGTLRTNISTNLTQVIGQPRMAELVNQLGAIDWCSGDQAVLDKHGYFYSGNALAQKGKNAQSLGQIDPGLEEGIFKIATQIAGMSALFGDASQSNPICMDGGSGRVYPENAPSETRGHIRLAG